MAEKIRDRLGLVTDDFSSWGAAVSYDALRETDLFVDLAKCRIDTRTVVSVWDGSDDVGDYRRLVVKFKDQPGIFMLEWRYLHGEAERWAQVYVQATDDTAPLASVIRQLELKEAELAASTDGDAQPLLDIGSLYRSARAGRP